MFWGSLTMPRHRRFLRRFFWLQAVLLCLACSLGLIASIHLGKPAAANQLPTQIETAQNGQTVLLPDWSVISLSMLPPIQSNGQVQIGGKSLNWKTGQALNQILRLEDLAIDLRAEELSLQLIVDRTGKSTSDAPLSTFELAGQQSLGHLAEIVPDLSDRKLSEVPPIQALVKSAVGNSEQTIGQALRENPAIASLSLNAINLNSYSIASIPNLDAVPLKNFQNWQSTLVDKVPGLNQVPLNAFPQPINLTGKIVTRIDMIYGAKEAERNHTISGSYQQGFSVACTNNCAYIELDDLENTGRKQRNRSEGLQWISGKYQTVAGGEGCLASINGGKEPTGRHPFGCKCLFSLAKCASPSTR
jgi:hypothetical protein